MVLAFSGVHGTAQEALVAVLVPGRPSVSVGSTAKVNRLPPGVAVSLGTRQSHLRGGGGWLDFSVGDGRPVRRVLLGIHCWLTGQPCMHQLYDHSYSGLRLRSALWTFVLCRANECAGIPRC